MGGEDIQVENRQLTASCGPAPVKRRPTRAAPSISAFNRIVVVALRCFASSFTAFSALRFRVASRMARCSPPTSRFSMLSGIESRR